MSDYVLTNFIYKDNHVSNKMIFLPFDNINISDDIVSATLMKKKNCFLMSICKVSIGSVSSNLDEFLKNNDASLPSRVYKYIDLLNDKFVYYKDNNKINIINKFDNDDIVVSNKEEFNTAIDNINNSILNKKLPSKSK